MESLHAILFEAEIAKSLERHGSCLEAKFIEHRVGSLRRESFKCVSLTGLFFVDG